MYKFLPIPLQNIAVSTEGYINSRRRYGEYFNRSLRGYLEREFWDESRLQEFSKNMRTQALVRAFDSNFYNEILSKITKNPKHLQEDSVFSELPIITRSDIQYRAQDLLCRKRSHSDKIHNTSGTSGISLQLPASPNVDSDQWAVWWRYRRWHGIFQGAKSAIIGGAPIVHQDEKKVFHRYNFFENETRFSHFHISENTASTYLKVLNKIQPEWIHAYPSALSLLAHYLKLKNLQPDFHPKAITLGSEQVFEWQIRIIQEVFGVRPRQHYGQIEAVANISECPNGKLHVDEDFGFVEFIYDNQVNAHRIVGTGFSNNLAPLIRYDTGDLAHLATNPCDCGRGGRVIDRLEGRSTDYLVLPNGNRVACIAGPFHDTPNLAGAQIYQNSIGEVSVNYIPGPKWKRENLITLEKGLRTRFGSDFAFEFREVDELIKTQRGKVKLVVSELETIQPS